MAQHMDKLDLGDIAQGRLPMVPLTTCLIYNSPLSIVVINILLV